MRRYALEWDEIRKKQFFRVLPHDLYWENKTNKLKRLIAGTEGEGGAGACRFDSRHRTNTQDLKNTEEAGTYFGLLTARPSHDHEDNVVPSPSRNRISILLLLLGVIGA